MRKLVSSILAALLLSTASVSVALACDGHDKDKTAATEKKAPAHVASATFKVEGMHCAGCADKVRTGLTANAAIMKVDAKAESGRVTVWFDADKLDATKVAKLISDLGYKASAEV
jgi:copper chaperone